MAETQKVELEPQQHDPYEDEIELMDFLKVLWKWKYLILVGTLICAVAAAVISLNMTKVYSIGTVLTPGVAKVDASGEITYIGSPQEIKTLIETGALESSVLAHIKLPNKEDLEKLADSLKFKVKTTKGSNALEISYETPDTDLGIQVLNNLNRALLGNFDGLVKYFKEEFDIQVRSKSSDESKVVEKIDKAKNDISTAEAENVAKISEIEARISSKKLEMSANEAEKNAAIEQKSNSILTIQAQMEGKKKQIKNLEGRLSDLRTEIGRISTNTDTLLEERDKFLSSTKNENNILASVMYTNTIQQNIAYLNSLRSDVNNVNHQIFQENVGIEKLENSIKDIGVQKVNLEKQTDIDNQKLASDIKDLQSQMASLKEQTKAETETLRSEIKALESEKEYVLEEVNNLEFKKNYVQNILILQPPKSSLYPVKPKKILNVMLAGVVGLFLTVFVAFFVEYVSKYRSRENER